MIFPRCSEKQLFFVLFYVFLFDLFLFFSWCLSSSFVIFFFFISCSEILLLFSAILDLSSLSLSPLFFVQLFVLSFNLFWCLVSRTKCFPKKKKTRFLFLKSPGIAKKGDLDVFSFLSFFFCIAYFSKKEIRFFKINKSKKTNLFSDVQNLFFIPKNENVKDDDRIIFGTFQKTNKKRT